jgi:hypothetical protein
MRSRSSGSTPRIGGRLGADPQDRLGEDAVAVLPIAIEHGVPSGARYQFSGDSDGPADEPAVLRLGHQVGEQEQRGVPEDRVRLLAEELSSGCTRSAPTGAGRSTPRR